MSKKLWEKHAIVDNVSVLAKTWVGCPVHLDINVVYRYADEEGGLVIWDVHFGAELEELIGAVPDFLERWCPAYLDDVYAALEELGLGFCRPAVPHEELHCDAKEGYED